jgi:hypothetical protein
VRLLPSRLLAVAIATLAVGAAAQDRKPPVPPGRDPGGVAIALIAAGIDYRLPALAQRLARDGEGELIGWDLEDNDRRPFDKTKGEAIDGTAVAAFLLGADGIRLVPVRLNPADPASAAQGLGFAARTPARVALLLPSSPTAEAAATLRRTASRFRHLLLILPADGGIGSADATPLDNVVRVEQASASESVDSTGFGGSARRLTGAALAVAAAGRAAAALLAREPALEAAALKLRLIEAGGDRLWRAKP